MRHSQAGVSPRQTFETYQLAGPVEALSQAGIAIGSMTVITGDNIVGAFGDFAADQPAAKTPLGSN